jgi:hypothetical protein
MSSSSSSFDPQKAEQKMQAKKELFEYYIQKGHESKGAEEAISKGQKIQASCGNADCPCGSKCTCGTTCQCGSAERK